MQQAGNSVVVVGNDSARLRFITLVDKVTSGRKGNS